MKTHSGHAKAILAVLLFLLAGSSFGDRFGDVNLTRLQNGLLPYTEGGGIYSNHTLRFKATNIGKSPVVLELRLSALAHRKVRLEPGASTVLTLQTPSLDARYSYRSDWYNPHLRILVNSKEYLHSFSIDSPWDRRFGLMFSNSLPEDKLKYTFYKDYDKIDKELMAIDSVENWSRDIQDYMGYRTIWVDSQEHIPDDVKRTLRQWMVDGGHLIRCVMPESEWPKETPQPKDDLFCEEKIGKGSLVTFRPFRGKPGKELDDFVNQMRSLNGNGSSHSNSKDIALPAVVNHSAEFASCLEDFLNPYGVLLENYFEPQLSNPLLIKSPKLSLLPLMLAMLLFVVLVGPVNYLCLRKRHKEALMLVTMPLFSLGFCLLVVAFVAFSFGFKLEGNLLGISYFDQTEKVASSIYLCSLMANSTNRKELVFTEGDQVTFMGEPLLSVADKPGMVLAPGILTPRNPLNYLTRRCEQRNERIRLIQKDGEAQVINGLPVPMLYLIARDGQGNAFISTGRIAEGSRHTLKACDQAEPVNKFKAEYFKTNPMMAIREHSFIEVGNVKELEPYLQYLPKNSFLAICAEPCFGTPGIRPAKGKECYVVWGSVVWE